MRYLLFIIFTLICVTGFGQTIPNPVFKGNVASTSLDAGNVYNIDITLISDATGIYNGTSVDDDGSWVVWKDCQRYVISTKTFAFATQFIGKVTDIHTNGAPALGLNAAVIKENSFGYASFVGGIPDGSQQCISQYYADILANQTSTASGDAIEIVVPHANAVNVGQLVTTNGSYSYVPADTSFAIATHGVVVSRTTGYATVVTEGKAYVPGHLLTLHVPLYVSDTPGEFTTTQYDENVQPIAIAFDTDSILVTSKMMLGGGFGGGGGKFVDGTNPVDAVYTIGSVGIGTTSPDAASTLDVVSTSQGSRPVPNMTEAQRDVINGGTFVEGLQVYNTDTKKFNYWDGTAWVVSGDETTWKLSGGGAPTTTTEDVYREGKVSVGSVFWNEGLMNINKLAADTVGLMFNTPDILLEDVLMRVRTPTNYREVELAYQSNENSLMFGNPLAALTYGNAKINALVSMTTGGSGEKLTNPFASVLMGYSVLPYATSSNSTTAIGYQTGFNLTSGNNNVLMGTDAGFNWTTVSNSIAIGRHPFFEGTSSTNFVGNYVTVLGNDGFGAATSGSNFGGFGHLQATAATSINQSYLIGDDVFRYRPTISSSTVAGYQAGLGDASGSTAPIETTIFGYRSKYNTDDISYSTSVGSLSGFISGAYNAAYDQVGTAYFGYQAGYNTYGSNSHFFGYRAGAQGSPTSVSNAVAIGYRAGDGQIGDNELYIANSNTATPLIGGNFSTAIAEIGGTLEVLTMATDNANSNVVVRNATTGALELNTSIGGNIYSADGTIPAASDRTATLADDLYFVPTVSEGLAIGAAPGTALNATFDIQSGSDEAIFTNAASAGNSVVHFNNGPGAVAEMRNFGDGNALTLQTEEGSAISASTAQTVNTNSAAVITKNTDDATGKNLVITERALSSATVTDGFGMYNQSILEDAANSALAAGYDEVTWTDATNGVAKRIIGVRGDGIAASGSGIALQGAGTDGYVQVGINSITPDASAALDVVSTTTGFLPPRMTTTQRDAISSTATGLQVYNTTTNQNNIYNGTSWVAVVTDADSYTHTFVAADWGGVSGAYTLTITAATHGLGTTLGADVKSHNMYSDDGTSVISETSTTVAINKTTGDITLTSSSPTTFNGKLVINK